MTRRTSTYGVTLVELLTVMAIIGLMTAVSVPVLSRMGMFGTKKADLTARELFAVMRGIQVHASTNNNDTAIIYSVRTPIDTLEPGEYQVNISNDFDNPIFADYRPLDNTGVILDGYMTVRKITPKELLLVDSEDGFTLEEKFEDLRTYYPGGVNELTSNPISIYDKFDIDSNVYVALESREGTFKLFPKDTAVLTNHPYTLQNAGSFLQATGLVPIFIVRIEINGESDQDRIIDVSMIEPRIIYENRTVAGGSDPQNLPGNLDAEWDYQFPAHVFHPDGTMDSPDNLGDGVSSKERIKLRLGLRPDQEIEDRFLMNPDTDRIFTEIELDPNAYEDENGNPINLGDSDELVGIESELQVFLSSGRVKVTS